jgi:hypothetical protein
MISLLSLTGYYGAIVAVLCAAAAVAALIYVPSPFKQYAVCALLLAAGASQIYSEGFHASEAAWQGKYDRLIAEVNLENAKAALAIEAKVRAEDAANADRLKAEIDAQTELAVDAQGRADALAAQIAAAPKTADVSEHPLVLDAIHGKLSK